MFYSQSRSFPLLFTEDIFLDTPILSKKTMSTSPGTRRRKFEEALKRLGFEHLIDPLVELLGDSSNIKNDPAFITNDFLLSGLDAILKNMLPDRGGKANISTNAYALDAILTLAILSRKTPDGLPEGYRRISIASPHVIQTILITYSTLVGRKIKNTYPGVIRAAEAQKGAATSSGQADLEAIQTNNDQLFKWMRLIEVKRACDMYPWVRNALTRQFLETPELQKSPQNPPKDAALMGRNRGQCRLLFIPLNFTIAAIDKRHWVTLALLCEEDNNDLTLHGFILDSLPDYIPRADIIHNAHALENAFRLFGVIDPDTPPIQYTFVDIPAQSDGFSCGYQFFERSDGIMNYLIQTYGANLSINLEKFAKAIDAERQRGIVKASACNALARRIVLLADAILFYADRGPRKGLDLLA